MIDCVNISNCDSFVGNPLYEQHKLRFESIIERQNWQIPNVNGMEYDQYDNPAAYYFVKRNATGNAIGVARLYPTDRPYMLSESFSHMVTNINLPHSDKIWEGSRFCVNSKLSPETRKSIIHELVLGYLEFAVANNIEAIVGLMYPVYWKNVFIKSGWDCEWLGDIHKSDEGHKIRAALLPVSKTVLANVRNITGIQAPVLNYPSIETEIQPYKKAS